MVNEELLDVDLSAGSSRKGLSPSKFLASQSSLLRETLTSLKTATAELIIIKKYGPLS